VQSGCERPCFAGWFVSNSCLHAWILSGANQSFALIYGTKVASVDVKTCSSRQFCTITSGTRIKDSGHDPLETMKVEKDERLAIGLYLVSGVFKFDRIEIPGRQVGARVLHGTHIPEHR